MTAELARTMIDTAERKAAEMGHPFVIAVVDERGILKAFSRMDGAALLSVQIAQDKAYTAAGFGLQLRMPWHSYTATEVAAACAGTWEPVALGALTARLCEQPVSREGRVVYATPCT